MTCPVMLASSRPCGRSLYGADTCIFHCTQTDKDCELFDKELLILLEQEDKLDCAGFIFPEKSQALAGHTFSMDASFRQAIFLGSGEFASTQFLGKADFTGAQFSRANFVETQFAAAVIFARSRFMGEARFTGARFQDSVTWQGAEFAGPVSFAQMRVTGRSDFSRSQFLSTAHFTGARFRAGVNFTGTQFHHKVIFTRARFADEVYFSETKFPSQQESQTETGVEMTEVSFERPEKVHFYLVDAGRISFLKTHLRRVDFTDVVWGRRKNGRAALWDELRPEAVKDYGEIARLYRQLRTNCEKEEDHRGAADFRYGQMEMRRLDVTGGSPLGRFVGQNFSLLACYKALSDYGENPRRASFWIVGVVLAFALLFSWVGLAPSPSLTDKGGPVSVAAALQTSLAAFVMLPRWIPLPLSSLGQWLALIEGLVGPVLIVVWMLAVARAMR